MNVFDRVAQLRAEGRAFALATVTWRRAPSSGKQGSRAIIHPDGTVEGWMGGACSQPTLVRVALECLGSGEPALVVLGEHDPRPDVVTVPMACSSEGAMEVYMEPMLPAPHAHVVGDSPMTATLVRLLEAIDWRVTSADEPGMPDIGPGSYVVVATQGHFDEQAVERALGTDAAYVGLVASEKRASSVKAWLREAGVTEEQLSRLRAPAGFDLGPTDHQGIAVAILAELVASRATAPSATPDVSMPEHAIDPVCEMTVDVATARWSLDHDGETFYFCAPGCMKAFSADPGAYL